MRSDHWNFLANLLGAPGAAEPPKEAEPPAAEPTETEQEAPAPVAAAAEEVRSRPEPDEPTVPPEAESIDFGSFDEPSSASGSSEVADADKADDVLEALTAVTPPPKLPGFGVLDDQEPDAVEASDEAASVAPQRAPAERTARGARGDRSEPRSRRRPETWDEADSAAEEPTARGARRDRPAVPAGDENEEEETRPPRRRRRGVRQRLSEGELPGDAGKEAAGAGAAGAGAGGTETVEDEDNEEEEPFGMGVVDESGEDETTARGRSRRRGRRGRGRSGGRSEPQDRGAEERRTARAAEPTPDTAPEPIGESAFDDDHEDDEEVEVIRRGRRRRSRRDRGGEEERATGEPDVDIEDEGPGERDRGDSERGSASRGRRRSATRRDETDEPPKRKNVPTWLDTVALFVDSNLENHKKSGRGGGSRGRSGRRR